ncbi:MAG: response regulator [Limisphaerales bacterium]
MKKDCFILIAEDDEADVFFWTRALRTAGLAHYHIVGDGAEAIDYLQSRGPYTNQQTFPFPDFLFLDTNMPLVNGYDVLEWMREHPLYVVMPTLLFMGCVNDAALVRGYELGATACFEKPVNNGALSILLAQIMGYWNSAQRPETSRPPKPFVRSIKPKPTVSAVV